MSRFIVCPSCSRHVRRSETLCPFCAVEVPEAVRAVVTPAPPAGLSRAKAYAFRAAILASTAAVACGSDEESPGPQTGGSSGTAGSSATGGSSGSSTGGSSGSSTGGSSGSSTGGSSGSSTGGSDGAGGSGGTGGTSGTGGTGGSGGTSGDAGSGGYPMPYGCVWPGPCGPVRT